MIGFAAGAYSVWFCTLTARNRLDISASQWNTSPIHGKVGSAVALKSLSVFRRVASEARYAAARVPFVQMLLDLGRDPVHQVNLLIKWSKAGSQG